ncbi:restriction endonuclease subunit S [Synechococcus lacustris]|uniref:restriction endonuclease subunit S n=1 Tax=Synechococcus lacustris TaxID=2116544 RepID=UPI001057591A|nr:restriction endonuclease subunit S [Synechococcus lacustris]
MGDIATLTRGKTYKGMLVGKPGVALLGLGSIVPGGGFKASGYKTYGGDCPEDLTLYPGDIYVSLKGATKDGEMIGSVARVPPEVLKGRLTQDTVCLRFKKPDTELRDFVYWVLRTPQYRQYCANRATGSAVVGMSRDDFLSFTLPSMSDGNIVATRILESIEAKIKLNRKTNETLEAMAKALFKSWFVDFDPVRAKAEGRPTGLPAEISDLFPDSFEDSELGEIPSGWEVKSAGTQYDVSIGKTPPRKESQWFSTSHADMPWLSIRDLGEVGVYADKTSERLTREAVDRFNVKIVPANTVVLSFKLTIGRVAITGGEMLTNEAIAHFSPLVKGAGSEYTYCLLSQYDYHSLGSTSSIATAVNSQILREMPLVVPPEISARAFCDATASIFSSIKCGQQETRCLSDLRDALLPKLISGEIRIPDAEKILEEVGV